MVETVGLLLDIEKRRFSECVTNTSDKLREYVTKGREGVKMWKICVTSFMDGPMAP